MALLRAVCLFVVLAGSVAASTSSPTKAAPSDLSLALGRALKAPGVEASRTAALAVDLETGRVVFSRNAGHALVPASVQKLAVSFAELTHHQPGYP